MSADNEELLPREGLVQIEKLEQSLQKDKNSLSTIISLTNLYLAANKMNKARVCITNGIHLYHENQADLKNGIKICEISIKIYQVTGFIFNK